MRLGTELTAVEMQKVICSTCLHPSTEAHIHKVVGWATEAKTFAWILDEVLAGRMTAFYDGEDVAYRLTTEKERRALSATFRDIEGHALIEGDES